MPLVAHNKLPTFSRLVTQGHTVLSQKRALSQDIRELHIGLLNLMPDAAFKATERQFVSMLASNEEFLIHLYPTTVSTENRSDKLKAYISDHYNQIEKFQNRQYDGLIISGANPSQQDMTKEHFWKPLIEVFEWAEANTSSILCSCLATHAIMKAKYGIERQMRDEKAWGIFKHQLGEQNHPLTQGLENGFDGPHSHYYDFPIKEIESTDLQILASNDYAGIYLAASKNGGLVLFQGHPEYSKNSLLKEYQREIINFVSGKRENYPVLPNNYFSDATSEELDELRKNLLSNPREISLNDEIISDIDFNWQSAGEIIYSNWLESLASA